MAQAGLQAGPLMLPQVIRGLFLEKVIGLKSSLITIENCLLIIVVNCLFFSILILSKGTDLLRSG